MLVSTVYGPRTPSISVRNCCEPSEGGVKIQTAGRWDEGCCGLASLIVSLFVPPLRPVNLGGSRRCLDGLFLNPLSGGCGLVGEFHAL